MSLTIYTIGDLDVLRNTLVGVAMLFDSSNNTLLVGTGASGLGAAAAMGLLITLTIICVKGIYNQQIRLEELLIMTIVYSALFVPKVDLLLEDAFNGKTTIVQDIPFGIAGPAALMSSVVHSMTEKMDVAFSTVNGNTVGLTEEGFASPLKLMMALRYGPKPDIDANFGATLQEYFHNCIKDSSGNVRSDKSLMASDDLATWFSTGNVIALTFSYDANNPYPGNAILELCKDSGIRISNYMIKWGSSQLGSGESSLNNFVLRVFGESNRASAGITTKQLADDAFKSVLASSTANTDQMLRNVVFSRLVLEARRTGGLIDTDAASSSIAMSEAMERWRADQMASGEMFQKTMNQAMSIFLFLFFALSPIVAVVFMMVGLAGLKMLISYMMFGLWTQSWLPVASVINFYVQDTVQRSAKAVYSQPGFTPEKMFSPQYIDGTYSAIANKLAMASSMMAMTPTITAAVLGGGMFALTSLAGKMSGQGAGYFDEKKVTGQDAVKTTGVSNSIDSAYNRGALGHGGLAGQASLLNTSQVEGGKIDTAGSTVSAKLTSAEAKQRTAQNTLSASAEKLYQDILKSSENHSSGVNAGTGDRTQLSNSKTVQTIEKLALESGFTADKKAARALALTIAGNLAKGMAWGAISAALGWTEKSESGFDASKKASFVDSLQESRDIKLDISKDATRQKVAAFAKQTGTDKQFGDTKRAGEQWAEVYATTQSLQRSLDKTKASGSTASANRNVFLAQDMPAQEDTYHKGVMLSNLRERLQEAGRDGVGTKQSQAAANRLYGEINQLLQNGGTLGQVGQLVGAAVSSADSNTRSAGEYALSGLYEGSGHAGHQDIGRGMYEGVQAEARLLKASENLEKKVDAKTDPVPGKIVDTKQTVNRSGKALRGEVGQHNKKVDGLTSEETYNRDSSNLAAQAETLQQDLKAEKQAVYKDQVQALSIQGVHDAHGLANAAELQDKESKQRKSLEDVIEKINPDAPGLSKKERIEALNVQSAAKRALDEHVHKYMNPGAMEKNYAILQAHKVMPSLEGEALLNLDKKTIDALTNANEFVRKHGMEWDVLDGTGG